MKKSIVSPSLLSADFLNLSKDLEMINQSEAEWLHVDMMDGVFVPNISIGFPVVDRLREICKKKLDVHYMVEHPENYIERTAKAGASIMTIHQEACVHLHRTICEIKKAGMKAGVALNPSTPVCMLEDIIGDIDMVLLMSVNPGFGGQKFIRLPRPAARANSSNRLAPTYSLRWTEVSTPRPLHGLSRREWTCW